MASQNEQESRLTAQDIAQMRGAILSAYPDLEFLYLRISDKWGVNVRDYFDTARGRITIVKDIADWAHSEGKLLELVGLAWTEKAGNPNLRDIVQHYFADTDELARRYALPPLDGGEAAPPEREPLEKIITERSRFSDMNDFIARLSTISHAICRVQYLNVAGTGFLIGRRSVLTNFHVLKAAIEQGLPGNAIRCAFDFHLDGQAVTFSGASAWKGPASPFSSSDLTGRGEPDAGSFDYALLYLEKDADRAAIPLPSSIPIVAPEDTVAIVQHPGGDAQAIAWGRVLEYPASGLRYRYDVATASGSSGSPVLSADLSLVALHHAADPAGAPKYNQGVPIWRIIDALKPQLRLEDL